MEIQFHPASGGARVRTLRIGRTGERWLAALAVLGALLAASLAFTAPVAVARAGRRQGQRRSSGEAGEARALREQAAQLTRAIRDRALDREDSLNRIALVYGVPAARWPLALGSGPEALTSADPETLAGQIEIFLRALERARLILEERERGDPDLAIRSPSLFPARRLSASHPPTSGRASHPGRERRNSFPAWTSLRRKARPCSRRERPR